MFERFFSTSKVVFGPPHTFGWVRCSELDTKGLEAWEWPDGAKVRLKLTEVDDPESLRAMLKHANQYGLKYIFVRDRYYEPLLAFAGWRKEEVYDRGSVTLWVKDGIAPARPTDLGMRPTAMEGLMWGTLPIGSSIVALVLVVLFPDKRRRRAERLEFPIETAEPVLREAR